MGLEQTNVVIQQRIRQGKVTLARMTPSKREEALNMGLSGNTLGRWCDVTRMNENMPWQLVPLHSAGDQLLASMADELGKSVVDLIDLGELNGDLTDERDKLIVLLGKETEELVEAHNDRKTPGRIDAAEAYHLLPLVRKILRVAATMEAELHGILNGEGEYLSA